MKRLSIALVLVAGLSCQVVLAQKKDGKKEISKPPKGISWQIKEKETGVEYNIIPYEVISPEGHKKCRELIKEGNEGFMFFIVVIDNTKGKNPIDFNAFGGDACFYYYPPKDPGKSKKDPPPESRKYGFVALQNYFSDSGNTPADKAAYKKIQEQFKTALKVAVGEVGWSLCCIRDGFIFDLPRNKVTWAIPGELPLEMKVKKYSKSTLKKANVELFGEE